eukprot:9061431-Lingulodinium_polyedra.AAC.1
MACMTAWNFKLNEARPNWTDGATWMRACLRMKPMSATSSCQDSRRSSICSLARASSRRTAT